MASRVLIVPDKFKGTLTAAAAAAAIARGWQRERPRDRLELLPMSDGGDGFGEVFGGLLGARLQTVRTVDAAHRPCTARWWWKAAGKSAIVETSNIIGLAMLPPGEFHPFQLDTFGLGAVMRAVAAKGATRCWMGIGGSATNDGGFGVARALGWRFRDRTGGEIKTWTALATLDEINPPKRFRRFTELIVAVDVQNPLLGPRGATRVYGPQKGLRAADFARTETCLRRLAQVRRKGTSQDFARMPGSGAAGGLGFGLAGLLGARLEGGFDLFARHAGLQNKVRAADVVITGEGAIDVSTLMGKGVGSVAKMSAESGVPCLGMAGVVRLGARTAGRFAAIHGLEDLTTQAEAKANAGRWLEELAAQMARNWCESGKGYNPRT